MTFDEYSKLPNKKWHEITDQGYFEAGAASRDAEIATLRKQVTLLRDELNTIYKLVPDLVVLMKPPALAATEQP